MRLAATTLVFASLLVGALAQSAVTSGYHVYATFIYARTGERTPSMMAPQIPMHLTSSGANQMYDLLG